MLQLAYLSHAGNYALATRGGMQDDYVFSNGDTSNEVLKCEQTNGLDDSGVRLDSTKITNNRALKSAN